MGTVLSALGYVWELRFLPLAYRWRINRLKRGLVDPHSGLELRNTIRHARRLRSPPELNPVLFLLRLLNPFPVWHYTATLPASSPQTLLTEPAPISARGRDLVYLRSLPLWRSRDTPQRSFYRLYEAFCAGDGSMVTGEVEYFWKHSGTRWATAQIEDPACEDPEKYAVMAALAEELVESFAWRLQLGLRRDDTAIMDRSVDPKPAIPERCPAWTATAPRLSKPLMLAGGVTSDTTGASAADDSSDLGPFQRRNIFAETGRFYTV